MLLAVLATVFLAFNADSVCSAAELLMNNDFESGSLSPWTSYGPRSATLGPGDSSTYAAVVSSHGGPTSRSKRILTELYQTLKLDNYANYTFRYSINPTSAGVGYITVFVSAPYQPWPVQDTWSCAEGSVCTYQPVNKKITALPDIPKDQWFTAERNFTVNSKRFGDGEFQVTLEAIGMNSTTMYVSMDNWYLTSTNT